MRISGLVLVGSVLANCVLLLVIAAGVGSSAGPGVQPTTTPQLASRPAASERSLGAGTWAELESSDLRTERDRLRREGFPPSFIRAILGAQIRESFSARRKALDATTPDIAFWKPPIPDPKTQAALRALAKEETKAINDLLGPDLENGAIAELRRRAPDLSQDKLEQLAAIMNRYSEQRSDLYASSRNGMTMLPADREKLNALDKSMHGEFAAVLTPTELADYDLRASRTANNLRNELGAFDPTEQEFRTLYQLRSAFDDQFGIMYGPPSPEVMRARNDAQKQLDNQIAAALGPERYADYQRSTDYSYRQTSALVARLDLPPETANQVYALKSEIEQRATAIRKNATTPAESKEQIAALAAEAQTKVTAALGTAGFEAYKQNGGQWLQALMRRPVNGQVREVITR